VIRSILLDILGPILLLVLLGALVRRRFKVDVVTLSKLNIYLFVPAFLFDQVSRSTLGWGQMGGVVVVTVLQVLTLGLLVWGIGRALRVRRETLAAIAVAVMFYNSGNYGLPLAELAYPSVGATPASPAARHDGHTVLSEGPGDAGVAPTRDGPAVQAFVVFCQNLLTFTVGLMIAASAGGADLKDSAKALLRVPTLYTITAALLARAWLQSGHELPKLVTVTAGFLSRGLVPVALVTLGAQLAVKPRWPRWKPVAMVLLLRLVFGPVQMAVLLYGLSRLARPMGWEPLDLWKWPAEVLIVTAAVPTAVNTLLITIEVGGDAELAADCVFWTTVFSCVTITAWLVAIKLWMPAMPS
jgi:predicted permease